MMHGRGKSDEAIVAVKPANKAERSAAELVERRAETKGNADHQSTRRTLCRLQRVTGDGRMRYHRVSDGAFGPEVGAVCGKVSRTDLCGGREVTRVPIATKAPGESGAISRWKEVASAQRHVRSRWKLTCGHS